jgi:hypothetical protein
MLGTVRAFSCVPRCSVRGLAFNVTNNDLPTFTRVIESQDIALVGPPLDPSPRATYKLRLNTSLPLEARSPLSAIQAHQSFIGVGGVLTQSPVCESPDTNLVCTGWCEHDDVRRNKHAHVVSVAFHRHGRLFLAETLRRSRCLHVWICNRLGRTGRASLWFTYVFSLP